VQCSTDKKFGVIKFVKIPTGTSAEEQNIYAESRIILRMPHPNIIRVRDAFKSKGEIGTTFELIEGPTMAVKMQDGKMTEKVCLDYLV